MTCKSEITPITELSRICPCCRSDGIEIFYRVENVPVHSVHLLSSQKEALTYPSGDIALGVCQDCGFISNYAFNPDVQDYDLGYEATQTYSTTFNNFHMKLAEGLIQRYDLRQKTILEIGCGQGEFLRLLCDLGNNRGIGFDPVYRGDPTKGKNIQFIKDFYSERYAECKADFLCCKMTLEHIHQPAKFVNMIRNAIGDHTNAVVFTQVPDVMRVLRDTAFWDIYYEHCSYFSVSSLGHLFEKNGFEILNQDMVYDDQYLVIEAKPSISPKRESRVNPMEMESALDAVSDFKEKIDLSLAGWRQMLVEIKKNNQAAAVWGAGSKAVAFLTTLNSGDEIGCAIDINPYKRGTYLAGTGQRIESPAYLEKYRPDIVIVMNPIYLEEIKKDLERMKLNPRLVTV